MAYTNSLFTILAKGGAALGMGLIAGFAGTIAIIISQMIEMKITKWTPRQIATDVLHHAVYACAVGLTYDAIANAE